MTPSIFYALAALTVALLIFVAWNFARPALRTVTVLIVGAEALALAVAGPARGSGDFGAYTRGAVKSFWDLALDRRHLHFSVAAWVALLVVGAAVYYGLEALSARREPPRADVADPAGDDNDETKLLLAQLRFRLPAVNLRKPGAVPGASKEEAVAGIIEKSSVPQSALAGAIVRLAELLLPTARRFEARLYAQPCSSPGADADDPLIRLTVDVRNRSSGASVAVATLDRTPLSGAASRAAAYVAANVLKNDPSAPDWTAIKLERADDLATFLLCPPPCNYGCSYRETRLNRLRRIALLEQTAMYGPAAGVVRHELALLKDLEGDYVQALRLHARNRLEHPRFRRGQYRLGMSLSMVAGIMHRNGGTLPSDPTEGFQEALDYLSRAGLLSLSPGSSPTPDQLLNVAESEFSSYRRSLWLWHMLPCAIFHRSERSSWMPLLCSGSLVQSWADRRGRIEIATSALELCRTRRAILGGLPVNTARLSHEADHILGRRRHPPWPCAYNLACALALTGSTENLEVLVKLLKLAAEAPDNIRASEWMGHDPDLEPLHGQQPFVTFLRGQIARDFGPDLSTEELPQGDDWFAEQVALAGRGPACTPAPRGPASVRVIGAVR